MGDPAKRAAVEAKMAAFQSAWSPPAPPPGRPAAAPPHADPPPLQAAAANPEAQQAAAAAAAFMQNPAMRERLSALKDDPEMKGFFEDLAKGGPTALMK